MSSVYFVDVVGGWGEALQQQYFVNVADYVPCFSWNVYFNRKEHLDVLHKTSCPKKNNCHLFMLTV